MKLSDIKVRQILLAKKEELESIVFERKNNEVREKCDIGFIFGGISMIPNRVDNGIELYKNELVEKLVVSGGIGKLNLDRKVPEAYKMYNYLVENGIPKSDIIVEDESVDTIGNIKNSLAILSEKYDINNLKYALITSDFHVRRCLGLFGKALGTDKNLTGSQVLDGITDINSWQNSFYAKRLIYNEALALHLYAKRNILLEDLDIADFPARTRRK